MIELNLKIRVKKVINGWYVEANGDDRVFTSPEDVVRFLARVIGAGGCVRCNCKPEEKEEKE